MNKRMLIDTTHAEETRVVVLDGSRLDDYDVETSAKRQLKGNIYLAKIIRVEPSLQAAFVEYGGNRHGFLAFGEIHPDYYQIPVADRERLIAIQEEEARAEEAREEAAESDSPEAQPESPDLAEQPPEHAVAFDQRGMDSARGAGQEPADELAGELCAAESETLAEPESVGGESDATDERRASPQSARFLRQYKIQEVIRRRQILLVQIVKEERGNKGAALTTYISLAGRFSVLMPNSPRGGGVSRKITSAADRRRLKEITAELDIPAGMAMIIRTAGAQRPRPEIRRDGEYLLRLWDDIREQTLRAMAPALIYEEANLIKRAIRDVYTRDVEEIVVDGETGWKAAREFMRNLMPANASKVNLWRDHGQPLFSHYHVEHHLDAMLQPTVQLRSGGYLVINQTEALVAIDVNSGRSTRERGIEETALRTNLEAADELARQLRLRDLAGLIVIDFIDMEARRHNAMVERRLKDALKNDRARIQVGQISAFGLLEMSRQRLRPSIAESSFVACPHCAGTGFVRGTDSAALHVLRAIEEEGAKQRAAEILVRAASSVVLYVLNHKRVWLAEIEQRHRMTVQFANDDSLIPPQLSIEKLRPQTAQETAHAVPASAFAPSMATADVAAERHLPANGVISHGADDPFNGELTEDVVEPAAAAAPPDATQAAEGSEEERKRKRRRRRRRGGRREDAVAGPAELLAEPADPPETALEGAMPRDEHGTGIIAPVSSEPTVAPAPPARRRRLGRTASTGIAASRGATPADPFSGSYDIFDMIEQDAAAAPPSALAMTPQPDIAPEPEQQLQPELPAQLAPPELAPPELAPPELALPERGSIELELIEAPAAKPKRPRAPRRPAAVDDTATPVEAVKPARKSRAKKPAAAAEIAVAPATDTAEAPASPPRDASVVQPILIDTLQDAPAPRTGWWKR